MPDASLVYILAASHSGSTLTAMLLNSHPDIYTAGELKATNLGDVDQYRCSCRSLLGSCEFWSEVSNSMNRCGHEYDVRHARTSLHEIRSRWVQRLLRPLHRGPLLESIRDTGLLVSPTWRREIRAWSARNADLIRSISAVSGAGQVVDSSKIAVRLKYLLRIEGLDIRVIRLVRDGRAVALTYMQPGEFADASDPALRGGGSGAAAHGGLSMTEAATEWKRSNEEAAQVLSRVPPEKQIRISYEELCSDTAGTMNAVQTFLGVEPSDAFLRFRDAEHHVVGNGMRLDSSSEIRLDDRWRDVLDKPALEEFDRIAGNLNRSFGYE